MAGRVAFLALVLALGASACDSGLVDPGGRTSGTVRIVAGEPATLDPAQTGDQASAAFIAQLFEGLTAFDADLQVRPALAASWTTSADGRRITFRLRPDLAFSDGSPLTAGDVVRSWLRLIDPVAPSPLAALLEDVVGASARLSGSGSEADVGLRASGDSEVVVDLVTPASDFAAIVAGPTFGVVPPGVGRDAEALRPGSIVGSGGYVLADVTETGYRLEANGRYWAGPPAIGEIELVTDLGGRSSVDAFEVGDVDYVGIGSFDASWIAFDAELGPALRSVPTLSLEYFGFDATRPPFDDARVRQAFSMAVDWARLVELGGLDATPARSMVPPGIPGRSDRDFGPPHDPDRARDLLAEAGFPAGRGFPTVTFLTTSGYAEAAVGDWERELGIEVALESMDFGAYFTRLTVDPPAIWSLGWVADYPGADDFLGILLGSGRANNFGRWSSPEFDAAIARAKAARTLAEQRAAFDDAEGIVQAEAAVIPIAYGTGWALARDGLLGAIDNGLGIIRFAGLAWADGS